MLLQIGDIEISGQIEIPGEVVDITMYASLEVETSFETVITEDGSTELTLALGEAKTIALEIVQLTGSLAGAEDLLLGMVEEGLIASLLDSLSSDALGSFPIPDIDLSGMVDGAPEGSVIALELNQIIDILGYVVLSGNVK